MTKYESEPNSKMTDEKKLQERLQIAVSQAESCLTDNANFIAAAKNRMLESEQDELLDIVLDEQQKQMRLGEGVSDSYMEGIALGYLYFDSVSRNLTEVPLPIITWGHITHLRKSAASDTDAFITIDMRTKAEKSRDAYEKVHLALQHMTRPLAYAAVTMLEYPERGHWSPEQRMTFLNGVLLMDNVFKEK